METEQIRSLLRTSPFKAFTLKTASGEEYTIRHPEIVAVSPSGRSIGLAFDEGVAVLDMTSIIGCEIVRN